MIKTTRIEFGTDADLLDVIKSIQDNPSIGKRTLASLEVTTAPKMTVKHRESKIPYSICFKGKVFCTSKRHVSIGKDYKESVNNQLKREGKTQLTFSSNELPYGMWVDGLEKMCIDTGKAFQLRTFIEENVNYQHDTYVYHYENGTELTEDEMSQLSGFLPKKSVAKNQGTDKEIKVRNFGFRGIMKINWRGVELVRK